MSQFKQDQNIICLSPPKKRSNGGNWKRRDFSLVTTLRLRSASVYALGWGSENILVWLFWSLRSQTEVARLFVKNSWFWRHEIRWKCPHFVEISPGCPHKHPLMRLDLRSAIWQPLPATNNKKRSRLQSHQLSVAAVTVDRLAATLTQFSVLSKFLCHHFFWRGQQSQSQLRLPAEKKGWKRNVLVILICYWGRGLWGMDVKMCGVWSSALQKTDVLVKLVSTSSGLPRYDTRVPTPDPNPWLGQDADQRTDLFYLWVLEETGRFCRPGTERPGARRGLDSGPNNRCTTAL